MSIRGRFGISPAALRASICVVENRIRCRRSEISSAAGSIANQISSVANKVEERIVAPEAIIAAGLFGAAIQRGHRMNSFGVLAILPLARAALRFLMTAASTDEQLSPREKREYAAAENQFTAEGGPVQPQTAPGHAPTAPTSAARLSVPGSV